MPCNADYLDPSHREEQLQRAAKLLVYLCGKIGIKPEKWMLNEARNEYASDERSVTVLCAKLKAMDPEHRDSVVYNAHDKVARDLASWWEEHQIADAEREKKEAAEAEKEKLKAEARKKLSDDELKALGLK